MTLTDQELAELERRAKDGWYKPGDYPVIPVAADEWIKSVRDALPALITEIRHLRAIRNDVLEEAARVAARAFAGDRRNGGLHGAGHHIAAAIRALKDASLPENAR